MITDTSVDFTKGLPCFDAGWKSIGITQFGERASAP